MEQEFIEMMLRQAIQALVFIELADLEEYVKGISKNNSIYDAVGPILDPTEYRDTLHSGRRDRARTHLQITQKLLEVRRLIDTLSPLKSDTE
jgi:hypothetical protein